MADRSVVVRLRADVAGYVSSIEAAGRATRTFADDAVTAAEKHKKSWEKASTGMAVAGGVLVGAMALATDEAAKFDAQMSVVKANIDDKTVGSMQRLSAAALQAGQTTAYSAMDAARAEEELAKAGLTSAQITGGALTAALTLASAGQLDLGTAAEYTASTMVQFGLKAKDASHIADVLSAGADKSLGGVTDLAEALKYSGVAASQFGLSVDQTVGALAEFASAGILGSTAGTGLREMLVRLAKPTTDASSAMERLGLNFFDAQGKFVGVANMAGQLHTKLAGLTDQQRQATLVTIFGQRAMAEANILYRDGAAGAAKWASAVNDAGFAQQQAATKLDNLSGDFTKLKNTMQVGLIELGQSGEGPLRSIVQDVTSLVRTFDDLSPAAKSALGVVATVGGGSLLAAAGIMKLTSFVAEAVKAFKELKQVESLAKVTSFLSGPWGVALGLAGLAVGAFAGHLLEAQQSEQELRDTLDQTTGAVTEQTHALIAQRLQSITVTDDATASTASYVDASKQLGVSLTDMVQIVEGNTGAMARLDALQRSNQSTVDRLAAKHGDLTDAEFAQLDAAQQLAPSYQELQDRLAGMRGQFGDTVTKQQQVSKVMQDLSGKTGNAADSTGALTSAQYAQEQQAEASKKAIDDLVNSVQTYGDVALNARSADREVIAAKWALDSALKSNKHTLDDNTKAGQANNSALDDYASKTLKAATADFKRGASVEAVTKKVMDNRKTFVEHATAMSGDSKAANHLADQLGLTKDNVGRLNGALNATPKNVTTKVAVPLSPAQAQAAAIGKSIWGIPGVTSPVAAKVNIDVSSNVNSAVAHIASAIGSIGGSVVAAGAVHKAAGGFITGPGSGTSDSVPAWLSNGEYVINSAATARYRPLLEALNAQRFATGGYVGGGSVDWQGISALANDNPVSDAALAAAKRKVTTTASATASALHVLHGNAISEQKSQVALKAAEAALHAVKTSGHRVAHTTGKGKHKRTTYSWVGPNAQAVHAAETRVTQARLTLSKATSQVRYEEGKVTADRKAYTAATKAAAKATAAYNDEHASTIGRYVGATSTRNGQTASFLANIQRLADKGFGALAVELLNQNDADAYALAANAVAMPSKAAMLQSDFAKSAALAAQYDALKARLSGAYVSGSPGYANVAHFAPVASSVTVPAGAGGGAFVGNLVLDSGELMGVIRGTVTQQQAAQARSIMKGGR